MIEYKKPTLSDIPQMQLLVAPEIESGVILPRSDDEIATNIRSYTLAMDGDKLVGFCALHIHSHKLAEIRSMIIDSDYRGKNIGSELVNKVCQEGSLLGLKEVLALTYQKHFFERLGFIEIPKESIPEHKIWADCIKCKLFPVCNEVSLIKTL
ncbi:MAG: N-acetyltransferase [Epsilonproteobacteria bacterium]|nr:N-acetyltransferase [Campylobacterota bacterium]